MVTVNHIKWLATAFLIMSTALIGLNIYPLGPLVNICGGVLWSIASIKMRDGPLIATNLFMTGLMTVTLVYNTQF